MKLVSLAISDSSEDHIPIIWDNEIQVNQTNNAKKRLYMTVIRQSRRYCMEVKHGCWTVRIETHMGKEGSKTDFWGEEAGWQMGMKKKWGNSDILWWNEYHRFHESPENTMAGSRKKDVEECAGWQGFGDEKKRTTKREMNEGRYLRGKGIESRKSRTLDRGRWREILKV